MEFFVFYSFFGGFRALFHEDVVSGVNLNDDAGVYVFVDVWMILLDKGSIGSFDILSCCEVVYPKYFVWAPAASWVGVGLLL